MKNALIPIVGELVRLSCPPKVEILTNFSFFYFYSKLFVSIDITYLWAFSLFKLYPKLFAFFIFLFLHGKIYFVT